MTRRLTALSFLLVLALPACNGHSTGPSSSASTSAAQLEGHDARAWLTPRGSMGEANYCAARLRLPLSQEPAWRFGYSPAQFTDQRLQGLLHYDGTLVGYAPCPSLLLLDAATGRLLDVPFVYAHGESAPREALSGIMFSPTGALLGHDDVGRYYAWGLEGGQLARRWLSPSLRHSDMGYAAGARLAYTGDNDGVTALDLATGAVEWVYPADRLVWNILQAADGTLLCLIYPGSIVALDGESGKVRWGLDLDCFVAGVCIDIKGEALYVATTAGRLQQREIATGALQWTYDFSAVFSHAERSEVASLTSDARTLRLAFAPAASTCTPQVFLLTFFNGVVLALSPEGARLWQRRLDSAAIDCLGLANALIVRQAYREVGPGGGPPQLIDVFNTERPDWKLLPPLADPAPAAEAAPPHRTTYALLRVLDPGTGEDLDRFEPEVLPISGLVPAGSKLVFGGSRSLADRVKADPGASPRAWILAYDWLEEGVAR